MYYSDELYHHGIKGQRWGRRNGPPYPLSAQTHAAAVRSAGRGSSKKKGKVGRLPSDMEMRSYNGVLYKKDTGHIGGLDNEDRSARRKRIARNVAIGAGLGAAALGTAYAIKKGRRSSLATGKATALGGKANELFGRARSLEEAGRGGALANRLTNQATRASGQARRYTNIASGYAKRRNIGIAAGALGLGAAALGTGSYIRDRRKRRRLGR